MYVVRRKKLRVRDSPKSAPRPRRKPSHLLNAGKLILDLYAGSGSWSEPYLRAGYSILRIDLRNGHDVRMFPSKLSQRKRFAREFEDIRDLKVHGVLAAPPCTVFAVSGAANARSDEEILQGLSTVDAALRIIYAVSPEWWALENPTGKLVKWLGDPAAYFQPYHYGDPWTKKTFLWGDFNMPEATNVVKASRGSIMDIAHNPTDRSITPPGFAQAFFEANP